MFKIMSFEPSRDHRTASAAGRAAAFFQSLMKAHHYLGALPKIGHALWYVASYHNQWLALICFSAAAWKCAARDQWIGWSYRVQYVRILINLNTDSVRT